MLVRQLIGARAGDIVEMPAHIARSCLDRGTAQPPEAAWPIAAVAEVVQPATELFPRAARKRG